MRLRREFEIAVAAVRALGESAGFSGEFTPTGVDEPQGRVDGVVVLRRAGAAHAFSAEVKGTIRRAHLPTLLETMRHLRPPAVLLTRHVSGPVAEALVQRGVNFIDTAGNAHIAHDGWFVLVTGRAVPDERVPASLSASVWKVAYALLRDADLRSAPIRRLAECAGVSPGAASMAVKALDERGWVGNLGRQRVVLRPEALWKAWEMGWIDRLASQLFVTHAVAPAHESVQAWRRWWSESPPVDVLVGGELGAQLLATDLVAETATLHVRRWDASMLTTLRLVPAERGPFTIRETFGDLNGCSRTPGIAHPMLVRAELLSLLDERLDASREALARQIESELPDAP